MSQTKHHRSQQQWQDLIAEQSQGSMTVSAYCKKHRLSTSSFYKWRATLSHDAPSSLQRTASKDPSNSGPMFVPLSTSPTSRMSSLLELTVGSWLHVRWSRR